MAYPKFMASLATPVGLSGITIGPIENISLVKRIAQPTLGPVIISNKQRRLS
jgi:hypothetical protein